MKKISTFHTLKLVYGYFFVLGDKDKKLLLYHAFNQHLGEINKRIFTEINKIDL
jgi:hypothetical protein